MFSNELASNLNSYSGNTVILGIRPEDFSLKQSNENNQGRMNAKIELIEPLGNENFVYMEKNSYHLIMRTETSIKQKLNENIDVYFALDKVHFFDSVKSVSLL